MHTGGAGCSPRAARVGRWVRERDLAIGYAVLVLAVGTYLRLQPEAVADRIVLESSTNLLNLRDHPLQVLVTSAAVVPTVTGLWVLAPLVLAYGGAQRWLGRTVTVLVAAIGHAGSTLFVAVLVAAGIARGRLDASLVDDPDVGVSYGLAAVTGLLAARVPGRLRWLYLAGLLVFWVGPLLLGTTPTGVGHVTALCLGLAMALLASRAARATPR